MRRRCHSPKTTTWSRHSRRIEPMSRSAKAFCHGLCGAVRTSPIPMPFTRLPEDVTVDCVAVAEEVGRCGIVGEGVHDLLGGPVGGGMLGHVEMDDPSGGGERVLRERIVRAGLRVGTVKKSRETRSRTWLARNVRQVCDGRGRCF